jgi:hypothetical protein
VLEKRSRRLVAFEKYVPVVENSRRPRNDFIEI